MTIQDHIERNNWWPAKEFFYDLISSSIKIYFDIIPSKSLRKLELENKNISYYKYQLENTSEWIETYEEITVNLEERYKNYILEQDTCFSYEAPPSVIKLLNKFNTKYCDFRISPIRFLPDLLIAVRTNDRSVNNYLKKVSINDKEILMEASKVRASYRYNLLQSGIETLKSDVVAKRLIYVGQTEEDSSLIYNGKLSKITDFLDEIKKYSKNHELCYLRHPSASKEHINYEIGILKKINGDCLVINEDSYRLLSIDREDTYIGISSGFLQEAVYFGKKSISLIPPICIFEENNSLDSYTQVPLDTFLSEEFLATLLGKRMEIKKISITEVKSNQLRFLHDTWWGYANFLLKPNHIWNLLFSEVRESKNSIDGIKKVLNFMSREYNKKKYEKIKNQIIKFSWYWNNEKSIVSFENDKVYLNGMEQGNYIILGDKNGLVFIILWTSGWVDFCKLNESNKVMEFINQINIKGQAFRKDI